MNPIIFVKYDDDGCNIYKCISCKNEINLRTNIQYINYCPFCGVKVYLKEFKNERKQKIIEAYNKRFPKNIVYDWQELKFRVTQYDFPTNINQVSIICTETREYIYDLNTGNVELEVDNEVLITYNRARMKYSSNGLKKSLSAIIMDDLKYFKLKYDEKLNKDKTKDLFDTDDYCNSRLIGYKFKVEIERIEK